MSRSGQPTATRNIDPMQIFVTVAESRSFSRAGARLGISASGVSKAISRFEAELGVKLINRTTRSVSLTDEGDAFFHRCRDILADIEDAKASVARSRSTVRGRLKVQVPVGIGRKIIIPMLPSFIEKHPEITIDIELNDRVTDLAEEGLDVLVAVGRQPDSALVARKLGVIRFVTCASPEYLGRFGEPASPEELNRHRCLAYVFPRSNRYREWSFSKNGHKVQYPVVGQLNCSSSQSLVDIAAAGIGVVTAATFICADAIEAGRLKPILTAYEGASEVVLALYLPSKHLSQRVRAFIDFLAHVFPPNPPWDEIVCNAIERQNARQGLQEDDDRLRPN